VPSGEEVRGDVEAAVALLQVHHVALREVEQDLGHGDVVAGLGARAPARRGARAGTRAAGRRAGLTTRRPGSLPKRKVKSSGKP
jgi:hypothetical protein